MNDKEFIARATELKEELNRNHIGSPGSFFAPFEEVGNLERMFVKAIAEGTLQDSVAVAQALVELGMIADSKLTDEEMTEIDQELNTA